jgi:hypothetical protein
VAYAPYNEFGDIYMNVDNWDILWFETKSIISTSTLTWSYTLLEKTQDLKNILLPKIWDLRYIPSFDSKSSIFWDNTSTINFIVPLWLKEYKKETSFMSYIGWNWGIFIDNTWNDWVVNDYIKYNLTPLNLKDKFIIEMSVRGGALKRTSLSKNFTLFDFWGSNNKLVLNTYQNKLALIISWTELNIYIPEFNNMDSNKYYKVIVIFEWGKFKLKVIWDWFEKSTDSKFYSVLNTNTLYIWSSSVPDSQWNDIIDYVKIYKN